LWSTSAILIGVGNHVFISYSRDDQAYVDRLVAALAGHGIASWIDREVDYGTRWPQVVRAHIDTSAAVVVVMTPVAEESVWVGREIDQAETNARPTLPLLLRGERFFRLAEHQYEDVRDGTLPLDRWFERIRTLTGSAHAHTPTEPTRRDTGSAQDHNKRGDLLVGLGRWEEALAEFDQAVALNDELAQVHNNRGLALRNLGRLDEALAAYEQAISLDPRSDMAWQNKAVVLWHLGRFVEQLAAADQAVQLNLALDKAHNSRGLALQELGSVEAALAAYDRALELNPHYAFALNNRGTLYLARGDHARALADFDRAIDIDATLAIAHQNRGTALANLGRAAESRAAFERAIALTS
jgi:tetratricopeptide (TPR) repeat protein